MYAFSMWSWSRKFVYRRRLLRGIRKYVAYLARIELQQRRAAAAAPNN